jgi:hypothetical protein
MGCLTETARWKLCVPRLAPIIGLIAKGFYLHSFHLTEVKDKLVFRTDHMLSGFLRCRCYRHKSIFA